MITRLMDLALRQRVVVLGSAMLLLVAGIYSFHELDIEAYPDPVQPSPGLPRKSLRGPV